ncbi:MAG: hypothetical protein L0215_04065 [Gemmataceae bacterium]|nr:hypothetical protein [Gemmataceae bacterium]
MKLIYLFVDRQGQLVRVRRAQVGALWRSQITAQDLGSDDPSELRLVSALCDDQLLPQKLFLLRLPLTEGRFTRKDYQRLRIFTKPECVTPREVIQHHTDGWPNDFFSQLAVLLDVPRKFLDVPLGIGGPLMMAAALRVSPKQALRYLS